MTKYNFDLDLLNLGMINNRTKKETRILLENAIKANETRNDKEEYKQFLMEKHNITCEQYDSLEKLYNQLIEEYSKDE